MNSKVYVACMAIALAAGSVAARAESSTPVKLSNAELKQMEQDAHTSQQYQELASYFRLRQQDFRQQAVSEVPLMAWRSQFTFSLAAKYPRPYDSSRNRYDYFMYETHQMSQKAAYYEGLAAGAK
ncbi:MAG: hypothetical protein ABR860_11245 [Terracidiphilus sp.]